jgi:hypothetical protein
VKPTNRWYPRKAGEKRAYAYSSSPIVLHQRHSRI